MGARRSVVGNNATAWLVLLLVSCATQQREPALERSSGSQVVATVDAQSGPQQAASEPARPPTVRIVNVAPGRFLLGADVPVEVATAAIVERQSAEGQWLPVPYELRDSCTPPTAAAHCRALAPGAPFAPLSWNATPCGPCCADQDPTPIEAGTYRLTLTACNGSGGPWSGPTFEMPASTDAVERWRATSNVQKVSVFRLDADRNEEMTDRDERTILGYPIIPGTEVVLSESVVLALRDWLRAPAGFSDAIMRRCFAGKRFGFRVERELPEIGHEWSEVAVDLGCQSIQLANQEGGLHSRFYTYFDTSRQGLLAILREAMPRTALKGR